MIFLIDNIQKQTWAYNIKKSTIGFAFFYSIGFSGCRSNNLVRRGTERTGIIDSRHSVNKEDQSNIYNQSLVSIYKEPFLPLDRISHLDLGAEQWNNKNFAAHTFEVLRDMHRLQRNIRLKFLKIYFRRLEPSNSSRLKDSILSIHNETVLWSRLLRKIFPEDKINSYEFKGEQEFLDKIRKDAENEYKYIHKRNVDDISGIIGNIDKLNNSVFGIDGHEKISKDNEPQALLSDTHSVFMEIFKLGNQNFIREFISEGSYEKFGEEYDIRSIMISLKEITEKSTDYECLSIYELKRKYEEVIYLWKKVTSKQTYILDFLFNLAPNDLHEIFSTLCLDIKTTKESISENLNDFYKESFYYSCDDPFTKSFDNLPDDLYLYMMWISSKYKPKEKCFIQYCEDKQDEFLGFLTRFIKTVSQKVTICLILDKKILDNNKDSLETLKKFTNNRIDIVLFEDFYGNLKQEALKNPEADFAKIKFFGPESPTKISMDYGLYDSPIFTSDILRFYLTLRGDVKHRLMYIDIDSFMAFFSTRLPLKYNWVENNGEVSVTIGGAIIINNNCSTTYKAIELINNDIKKNNLDFLGKLSIEAYDLISQITNGLDGYFIKPNSYTKKYLDQLEKKLCKLSILSQNILDSISDSVELSSAFNYSWDYLPVMLGAPYICSSFIKKGLFNKNVHIVDIGTGEWTSTVRSIIPRMEKIHPNTNLLLKLANLSSSRKISNLSDFVIFYNK